MIICSVIVFSLLSCGGEQEADPSDKQAVELIQGISVSLAQQDNEKVAELARLLCELGSDTGNEKAYLYGLVHLSQSHYLTTGTLDSIGPYIDEALDLALKNNDHWAVVAIKNMQGTHMMFNHTDFWKGMNYLLEAIPHAELSGSIATLSTLKANIALAYYVRNDPDGLQYAQDVYELGLAHQDEYMTYIGCVVLGYLYDMLGQYELALEYTEKALPFAAKYGDLADVYSLYGDVLVSLDRKDEGISYYEMAISARTGISRFSDIRAYLGYGLHLKQQGRLEQALRVMHEGVEKSHEANDNSPKLYLLYYNISSLYDTLGDPASALEYYKLFQQTSDSLFNMEKERALGKLRVQSEQERHANEMQIKHIEWNRKLYLLLMLLVIVIIITVGAFVLQYRKERTYRQLLKQHHQALSKEKWYQQQLESSRSNAQLKKNPDSEGQKDKMEDLFNRLQSLMHEQKLYRQPDISRERLAEMLSTNRTYLTNVISHFTGLSFVYYINSFRLEEAVEMLSDTESEVPIKAMVQELGFRSLSTFYRLFQATTGIPPSQFREKAAKKS